MFLGAIGLKRREFDKWVKWVIEVRLKQKAVEDRGGGLGWGFEPSTPFQTILNCPRSGHEP